MAPSLLPSVRPLALSGGPYIPMPVGPGAGIPGGGVPLPSPTTTPTTTGVPTTPDGGIDWLKWAGLALAGYSAYNAAKSSGQAGQLTDQAIGHAKELWTAGEPLRAQGMASILTPRKVNLSSVYADQSNPFASRATAPSSTPSPAYAPSSSDIAHAKSLLAQMQGRRYPLPGGGQ
jgi:hypothetical protein